MNYYEVQFAITVTVGNDSRSFVATDLVTPDEKWFLPLASANAILDTGIPAPAALKLGSGRATLFVRDTAPTTNQVGDLWVRLLNDNTVELKAWNGIEWIFPIAGGGGGGGSYPTIPSLTALADAIADNDLLRLYDTSASAERKITITQLKALFTSYTATATLGTLGAAPDAADLVRITDVSDANVEKSATVTELKSAMGVVTSHGALADLDDPAHHTWAADVAGTREFTDQVTAKVLHLKNRTLPAAPAEGAYLVPNADELYVVVPGKAPQVIVRGDMGIAYMEMNLAGDDYIWSTPGNVAPHTDTYRQVWYEGSLDPKNALTNKPTALPAGKIAVWTPPVAAPGSASPIQQRQVASVSSPTTTITFADYAFAASGNFLQAVITARAITTDPNAVEVVATGGNKPMILEKKITSGNSATWLYRLNATADGTETGLSITTGGRTYDRLMIQELVGVDVAAPYSTWNDQSWTAALAFNSAPSPVVANTAEDMIVALGVLDEQGQNLYSPSGSYAAALGSAGVQAPAPSFKMWASFTAGFIAYAKPGVGGDATLNISWATPSTIGAMSFARLKSKVV